MRQPIREIEFAFAVSFVLVFSLHCDANSTPVATAARRGHG